MLSGVVLGGVVLGGLPAVGTGGSGTDCLDRDTDELLSSEHGWVRRAASERGAQHQEAGAHQRTDGIRDLVLVVRLRIDVVEGVVSASNALMMSAARYLTESTVVCGPSRATCTPTVRSAFGLDPVRANSQTDH